MTFPPVLSGFFQAGSFFINFLILILRGDKRQVTLPYGNLHTFSLPLPIMGVEMCKKITSIAWQSNFVRSHVLQPDDTLAGSSDTYIACLQVWNKRIAQKNIFFPAFFNDTFT